MTTQRWAVGVLLVGSLVVASSQPLRPSSVAGTSVACDKGAAECPIVVRVEPALKATGKCSATVDMAEVRVKKEMPVRWLLLKSSQTDSNIYEFVDPGIQWTDEAAAKKEFSTPVSEPASTPVAYSWTAAKKGSKVPLGYRPLVRIQGSMDNCDAADPTIANDG